MSAFPGLLQPLALDAADRSFFHGQLTFKSLFEDKEDTPAKQNLDRSPHMTPTLSLGIDQLVQSPPERLQAFRAQAGHVTDFELQAIELRLAGDLFTSAKKKYSGNHFESVHLETCSTSSEASTSPQAICIFEALFAGASSPAQQPASPSPQSRLELGWSHRVAPPEACRPVFPELRTVAPLPAGKRVRLGDFIDGAKADGRLDCLVQAVKEHISEREKVIKAEAQGSSHRPKRLRTESRFTLF